ncbi:OmpA family protein [Sphingobacterium kitahiroshimense]|uniref:OmpA family protein n=1 Tax=Sphingobacterium kitahiroshimense TaxID=470446 RepID=A0ABV0BW80_9SPHI
MTLKKTLLIFLAAAGTKVSVAQQLDVRPDTSTTITGSKFQVNTNPFWDNWFIGAGAGAQMYYGDHDRQMKFSERLTPSFDFYVGKWFTPGIGVRAGVSGFKIKGATQDPNLSTGEKYDGKPWAGYGLYNQELNYFNVHGDVMFNLSNMIGGYNANRVYSISPYAGLGWMVTNNVSAQKEVSLNAGIFNSFRLSDRLDLTLDVRGTVTNDRFDGESNGRRQDGMVTTLVGLAYKFNKNTWEQPKTVVIKYNEEVLNKLRDQVSKLSEDNDALRQQLASSSMQTITDVKVEEKILAAPILVTFPIGKSTVSNDIRVNLGFFAKVIKSGSSTIVYKVTGYADKGTGTDKTNERLSKERAQAIYNVLVHEFDVNPSQLEVDHKGGVVNEYYNDPRLSRAVITIAK